MAPGRPLGTRAARPFFRRARAEAQLMLPPPPEQVCAGGDSSAHESPGASTVHFTHVKIPAVIIFIPLLPPHLYPTLAFLMLSYYIVVVAPPNSNSSPLRGSSLLAGPGQSFCPPSCSEPRRPTQVSFAAASSTGSSSAPVPAGSRSERGAPKPSARRPPAGARPPASASPGDRERAAAGPTAVAQGRAEWDAAVELQQSGKVWEGKIELVNRGGAVVRVGKLAGFIPFSQLDPSRIGQVCTLFVHVRRSSAHVPSQSPILACERPRRGLL